LFVFYKDIILILDNIYLDEIVKRLRFYSSFLNDKIQTIEDASLKIKAY
jgi:hypothetical protein